MQTVQQLDSKNDRLWLLQHPTLDVAYNHNVTYVCRIIPVDKTLLKKPERTRAADYSVRRVLSTA